MYVVGFQATPPGVLGTLRTQCGGGGGRGVCPLTMLSELTMTVTRPAGPARTPGGDRAAAWGPVEPLSAVVLHAARCDVQGTRDPVT